MQGGGGSRIDREFVIVGAGSAGAVLASRWTEDRSSRVTLIETGRNYRSVDTIDAITTPAMSPSLDTVAPADD